MPKILIVENDMDIQKLLQEYTILPKIDGFGVCELIRKQSQMPIIMLTALG